MKIRTHYYSVNDFDLNRLSHEEQILHQDWIKRAHTTALQTDCEDIVATYTHVSLLEDQESYINNTIIVFKCMDRQEFQDLDLANSVLSKFRLPPDIGSVIPKR